MTVRHSVQRLVQLGLVHAHVGSGTYVTEAKIHQQLQELTGFTEDMTDRGLKPGSIVVRATTTKPTKEIAALLEIAPAEDIHVLERVRLAEGEPIALEAAHIHAEGYPNLLETHNFAKESLYDVLRTAYDRHLIYANQQIGARLPTPHEQTHLGITAKMPVLSLTRVTYDRDERPVEAVKSAYVGSKFQLSTTLRVGNPGGFAQ